MELICIKCPRGCNIKIDGTVIAGNLCPRGEIYAKEGLFVYKRQAEDSELLIVVNLGDKEANLRYDGTLIDLLNNDKYKDYIPVKSNFLGIFICD